MNHEHAGADDFIHLAAEMTAAYVANNSIPAADLPGLLKSMHQALRDLATQGAAPVRGEAPAPTPLKPAVAIDETVHPDHIICLEDGQSFRSLKRHLGTAHGMTPQEYRAKWNLPVDYPMVAPNYAEARSAMAKKIGLGQRRKAAKQV